jgi:hypothetical protein
MSNQKKAGWVNIHRKQRGGPPLAHYFPKDSNVALCNQVKRQEGPVVRLPKGSPLCCTRCHIRKEGL